MARHFAAQGMLAVLARPVEVALPPVGLIRLRGEAGTPVTQALVACLREVGAGLGPSTLRPLRPVRKRALGPAP